MPHVSDISRRMRSFVATSNIAIYLSVFLGVLLLIVIIWRSFGWFEIKRDFVVWNVSYLEKQWWVPDGSLIPVVWTLKIWPYKDLRNQRYQFVWSPKVLQFWLYNFTLTEGKRFFNEIASKGTKIQGVMESTQYQNSSESNDSSTSNNQSQFEQLKDDFLWNKNLRIVSDQSLWLNFQHAKTFLMDTGFIIQTANVTYSSYNKNREIFFMGTDSGVLLSLQELFKKDWGMATGGPLYDATSQSYTHPNLVVCPINCRHRIETLVDSAQNSIVMYQQYITDSSIQHILKKKKQEWIMIQLILWQNDSNSSNGSLDEKIFLDAMKDIIKYQSSPYVHAKAILVDNQFLLIGSMNMSANSLDNNREIGILLLDPEHIRYFTNVFTKDWRK